MNCPRCSTQLERYAYNAGGEFVGLFCEKCNRKTIELPRLIEYMYHTIELLLKKDNKS